MKNKYEISGNELILYLDRHKGEPLKAVVDTEQFEKLESINVKWYPKWDEDIQSFYVQATKYLGFKENGKRKATTLYLHKVVLNYQGKSKVDHINHDTLNNKKENLRISEAKHNSTNRKGKNSNNRSGYRNVCWIEKDKVWRVQLQVEGKNTKLGDFKDVNKAGEFAAEMREKYYKKHKGYG